MATSATAAAPAAATFTTADIPPNSTLYINNINEKVKKGQLKRSLYAAFSPFGKIIDIVVMRTEKTRGQAWVVFEDVAAATNAMRELNGTPFHDKNMRINFARTKSAATEKREGAAGGAAGGAVAGAKRKRGAAATTAAGDEEDGGAGAAPPSKRAATEAAVAGGAGASASAAVAPAAPAAAAAGAGSSEPNRMLLATGIPPEITEPMLRALFSQFQGLTDLRTVPERGLAFIEYASETAAIPALSALNGFRMTDTAALSVTYAKK